MFIGWLGSRWCLKSQGLWSRLSPRWQTTRVEIIGRQSASKIIFITVWKRLLEQWPDKLMTCFPQSGQIELFAFFVIFSNLSACVNLASLLCRCPFGSWFKIWYCLTSQQDFCLGDFFEPWTLHPIFLVSHCANKSFYIYWRWEHGLLKN